MKQNEIQQEILAILRTLPPEKQQALLALARAAQELEQSTPPKD